jgi:hypothetical protein
MGSPEKELLRSLAGVVSCVCTEQPHSGACRTILDGHGRPVDDCSQRAGSCHHRPYADLSGYSIPPAVASQVANLSATRGGALPAAARFSCACGVGKPWVVAAERPRGWRRPRTAPSRGLRRTRPDSAAKFCLWQVSGRLSVLVELNRIGASHPSSKARLARFPSSPT